MEVQSQINENTVISPQERQEFDEFKRQKRVAEARAIISRIELSFTAPSADRATLRRLLKDGEKAGLGGVCVTPYFVKPCSDFLGTASAMSVAAAISAWGGSDTTDIKVRQVKRAIRDGADAVEVAAPLSAVKEGSWGYVKREFKKLKSAAKRATLRINLEAPLLTSQELTKLCTLAVECGIACLRTAGDAFGSGADEEDLKLIKAAVKDRALIKADGADTPGRMATLLELGAGIIGSAAAVPVAQAVLAAAEK